MVQHFQKMAETLTAFLNPKSFVVELGSNDGTLLENFQRQGIRCLGIEPSGNVAARAQQKGIPTQVTFFSKHTAQAVREQSGAADLLIACNCLCHIPDLSSVFEGVESLLSDEGVLVFEDPYLGEVLKKTAYDQIYDEHVYLFSVTSMNQMLARYGFKIFDVELQWTHGGSMRFFIQRQQAKRPISPRVAAFLQQEQAQGINELNTYEQFRDACEISGEKLLDCLQDFKRRSIPVAGYAATSKSTTILNYCGIGPDLISYICDTTPEKQGKFTPGSHIPVLPHETFQTQYPGAAVLFAWNHAEEILAKEKGFRKAGGKWVHFIPEVRIE